MNSNQVSEGVIKIIDDVYFENRNKKDSFSLSSKQINIRLESFVDENLDAVKIYLIETAITDESLHQYLYDAIVSRPDKWEGFIVEELNRLCRLLDQKGLSENIARNIGDVMLVFACLSHKDFSWKEKYVGIVVAELSNNWHDEKYYLFEMIMDHCLKDFSAVQKYYDDCFLGKHGDFLQDQCNYFDKERIEYKEEKQEDEHIVYNTGQEEKTHELASKSRDYNKQEGEGRVLQHKKVQRHESLRNALLWQWIPRLVFAMAFFVIYLLAIYDDTNIDTAFYINTFFIIVFLIISYFSLTSSGKDTE